jgi:hypothetical protein
MNDSESHFSHNDRHAKPAKVILFRHHDLCKHRFFQKKHHPTRDCKCVLGDEERVVPFRKEIRQRHKLRIQAVAILHGFPKLLMPSSLWEEAHLRPSPVPPFRLPNSHVLYRPRNIIISLRVQESRTAKLAGTLSGSAPIPSLCSLRWQGGPAIRTLLEVIFSAVKIVMLLDLGLPLSLCQIGFDILVDPAEV